MAAELFYVLGGALQVLVGDQVVLAETGDVVMVPPGVMHAFAAAPGCDAELLAIVTPGAGGPHDHDTVRFGNGSSRGAHHCSRLRNASRRS
jgi:quercetin dioxygenase-like cupin family protein